MGPRRWKRGRGALLARIRITPRGTPARRGAAPTFPADDTARTVPTATAPLLGSAPATSALPAASSAARRAAGRLLCAAAIALYAYVLLRSAWVSDDSFITLRTVDNFVRGRGLRWNADERVQTFTHPLWMLVVSAGYAVTREAFATLIALSCAVSLAVVLRLAGRFAWTGVAAAAVAALASSRAFVDYSTSGLENPLAHLLLLAFVLAGERARLERATLGLTLAAGLLVLNRADGLLLVAPALAVAAARERSPRALARLALGFAPLLAWLAFATLYYGFPLPNTAPAKLATGIPADELRAQGLAYLADSLARDPLTLTLVALGVVTGLARRRALDAALAAGILLHLAYVVRVGGDFMSGRFLSAPLLLAVLLLARAGSALGPARAGLAAAALVLLGLAAPHPALLSGTASDRSAVDLVAPTGIADERRYYSPHTALVGRAERGRGYPSYVGTELRRQGAALAVEGAVGFLAFEAGPGVHVVDYHALGDPLLARLPAAERDPLYERFARGLSGEPPRRPWRVGHYLRALPEGYLSSLASGEPRIADPEVALLHERLLLITRGPVWSRERLALVARMNLGLLPDRVTGARTPYRPPPWREVVQALPGLAEAHYWLGEALWAEGDLAGACAALARCLELDPQHARALLDLAVVEGQSGRPERARELALRVEALDPAAGALHLKLAGIWRALGEPERAARARAEGARLDPVLAAAGGS